jgi:hypothetical protein
MGLLAALLFRRGSRYRNLVGVLAEKIDRIKNPAVYAALTTAISDEARSKDLERALRGAYARRRSIKLTSTTRSHFSFHTLGNGLHRGT